MHEIILKLLLVFCLLIRCTLGDEDLKYKIAMPEFICDKDGSVKEVSKDMTSIRLLGKDAQNVDYKFDVNFKKIGGKCRNNQRCTLLLWKSVRELDAYLKKYPGELMQTGLIEINNTMFMPGVQYILNVTVVNDGNVLETKQLTLDYVDEDVKRSVTKPMASILLLAADTTYAFATYFINAEVALCSDIEGYYLKWQIFNEDGSLVEDVYDRGAELKISPYVFRALRTYTIRCYFMDMDSSESVSSIYALHVVSILSKGIQVTFPLKTITVEVNQPVTIKPLIRDLDNSDETLEITWICSDEMCEETSGVSELKIEDGFPGIGRIQVTVEVSKGDLKQSDTCDVEVIEDSPTVEIDDVESPVSTSKTLEIRATAYRLKTSCTMQWTCIDGDQYEPLNLSLVPGNVDELINITLKEDLFLHELDEFTNGTIDKRHDLVIPPKSLPSWDGLKGDVTYKFRLVIICPPFVDFEANNETEWISISSYTDVVITTNAAPLLKPLQVTPAQGEAFMTTFSFKTQKAEDKPGDEPILYKFGYKLGNRDVIVASLGDVLNTEAVLPYSEKGIETFLEACDVYDSCNRLLGPVITTTLAESASPSSLGVMQSFNEKMNTQEFYKAFTIAFTIIHSFKSNEHYEKEVRNLCSEKINTVIGNFLQLEEDDGNKWKGAANDLIKNMNEFSSEFKFPESTLNNLVELRNKLSSESRSKRSLLSVQSSLAAQNSLEDLKRYAEVSEMIITNSNDTTKVEQEKERLRKKLEENMEKLCGNDRSYLELKTVILSVEKLSKNSNFLTIPFDRNSWNITAKIKINGAESNCIGKAVFNNYLGKTGKVFMAETFGGGSGDVTILLPLEKHQKSEPKCIVYRDGWENCVVVQKQLANYVKCSCKHLGYFFLEYSPLNVDSTEPAVTIAPNTAQPTESIMVANTIAVTSTIINPVVTNSSSTQLLHSNKTDQSGGNYETLSYIVIVASLTGIVLLVLILRKIMSNNDDNDDEPFENIDFPRYAQLYEEETLNDAHM